ncbi:hypothetical protein F4561_002626 [Lipingzhangella halophila]|uniref:Uncharacterized protein n=1 Tax=Lipingzhangella halophila TaxID=1783352 RepID=A0A7W7RGY5_9ACTN|nr:hypothetical protein [Lipingzhangella halophila]MBB4931806.1 hypothetical protein [Lipingzhangella halophila]
MTETPDPAETSEVLAEAARMMRTAYTDWCPGCRLDVAPDWAGCQCPPGPASETCATR